MKPYRLRKGSVQWKFAQSRAKIQIFGGGYGNGKTTALAIKALRVGRDYPGCKILLGRATYPKLNGTLRAEFVKWCPGNWVRKWYTDKDNTIYLKNGTEVHFRYIAQRGKSTAEGETTSNVLGATYDFIGIDQIEDPEFSYQDFLDMIGRLRGSDTPYRPEGDEDPTMPSDGPRWLILTCNPTRNWVYKKLVQPFLIWLKTGRMHEDLIVDEETKLPIMELFEGPTKDNAENLAPDFISTMNAAYKGQQKARYSDGSWDAYEGLVYAQYDRTIHMLPRATIIDHLQECRERHVRLRMREAYDFGLSSPTCYGLSFIDDWSRMFLIDGFHEPNYSYELHAPRIMNIRGEYMHLGTARDAIECDPDIFRRKVVAKEKVNNDSVAKLLRADGLKIKPADNDITAGIAKVGGYLNGHPMVPHPLTGDLGSPLFFVAEELVWFDDEISSYYWKKNPQGQFTDEPQDENDHAMDMTKYLHTKLPNASDIVIPVHALPPKWKFWHEVAD